MKGDTQVIASGVTWLCRRRFPRSCGSQPQFPPLREGRRLVGEPSAAASGAYATNSGSPVATARSRSSPCTKEGGWWANPAPLRAAPTPRTTVPP